MQGAPGTLRQMAGVNMAGILQETKRHLVCQRAAGLLIETVQTARFQLCSQYHDRKRKEESEMNTGERLQALRLQHQLTQDEMAERLFVTRQAVSRWETGETVPNTETLKCISNAFGVSIDALLGQPPICQCCGMPLEDEEQVSREADGRRNGEYCKWCYADGKFTYSDMESLKKFLVAHMSSEEFPPEQAEAYFSQKLPRLRHWRGQEES